MKTIRAIKKSKEVEVGEIKRVDDKTAHNMVGMMWEYISKSDWKLSRGTKSEPSKDQVGTKSEPISEQIERKPYKKGTKPEKKSTKNEKNS
jgi:hypothetical protein